MRAQGAAWGEECGLHYGSFGFQTKLKYLGGEVEMISCQQN